MKYLKHKIVLVLLLAFCNLVVHDYVVPEANTGCDFYVENSQKTLQDSQLQIHKYLHVSMDIINLEQFYTPIELKNAINYDYDFTLLLYINSVPQRPPLV